MMNSRDVKWETLKKCYVCGSSKINLYLEDVRYWENPISFKLAKCNNCNFIFVNPRPKQKYIHKFYKSDSYWGQNLNKIKQLKQKREDSFESIYALVDFEKKQSIFDIGAGTGLFLSKFKEQGWKLNGIEYSKEAVSFAKKSFGISLLTGDLLDKKIDSKYDYIVLNNVLEHLYKPLETLKKTNKMLNKNGKLIIAVPNIDSLGFILFKKDWYPLQPPIHLSQFSPSTMNLILNKSGFKVIKIIHKNPIHSKFSIFESYRSKITGRNNNEIIKEQIKVKNENDKKSKNIGVVKTIGVVFGKMLSYLISFVGYITKRGENIIIYAEKK